MCPNIKEKQIFGLSTLSTDKAKCLLTWPLKHLLALHMDILENLLLIRLARRKDFAVRP